MITYIAVLRNNYYHVEILVDGISVESHPHEYTNFTEEELKDAIEISQEEFREILRTQNTGNPEEITSPPPQEGAQQSNTTDCPVS